MVTATGDTSSTRAPSTSVRVALLGDIFVDLQAHGVSGLPAWGEDRMASAVHLLPGGSCANTARHLASIARSSFCVSLFSTLGDDELGRHFLRRVIEEGLLHEPHATLRLLPGVPQSCCLILSGVRHVPAADGAASAAEADRAMVSCYSSTSRLSVPECSPALDRGGWDVLHLGGYFNCPQLHSDDLLRLCGCVRASGGVVSFDPQFDASERWEGQADHLARLLPHVDVMLLAEAEAAGIAGRRRGQQAAVNTPDAVGEQVRLTSLYTSP
jgi:sugar/nucleoside kinase (ribokinase family)